MGEALYFYFLIVSTKDNTTEQKRINEVLSWSPVRVELPSDLAVGLTPGIAETGIAFTTQAFNFRLRSSSSSPSS